MFGYLIPRNYMEDMQFDKENKNSKWYDAIKLEMESMQVYKVFKKWDKAILDKHKRVTDPHKGYHKVKVHLVFAVKFDGRHKTRLVADGHITHKPKRKCTKTLPKAPCLVALNVYLTLHLLLFLIFKTINVRLD